MLLINWCWFAPAPHWVGNLCACCIIQMAVKACQLNYRGFTRNIMSCPTISEVTSRHRSWENLTPYIQLEKRKTFEWTAKISTKFFGCQLKSLSWLSSVGVFYLLLYVVGSAFMIFFTFKAFDTPQGFPLGGCRTRLSLFRIRLCLYMRVSVCVLHFNIFSISFHICTLSLNVLSYRQNLTKFTSRNNWMTGDCLWILQKQISNWCYQVSFLCSSMSLLSATQKEGRSVLLCCLISFTEGKTGDPCSADSAISLCLSL